MNGDGYTFHRDNVPAARELRKRETKSEDTLWEHLRSRRFYGLKFRRQHPIGAFVLDFFCQEMMFAVEIDGGIHRDPEVAVRDLERQRTLEALHIQSFRWTAEAETDAWSSSGSCLPGDRGPGKRRPFRPGRGLGMRDWP
ncbi:endonuclease domain-containing protein [Candidatus Amarobacter glycogenicus]|uniref:endonuclease domain-containing protein n=1 Tax=Candidatus Amarobacter glycogenicus TaxID=3140699 RepID=UPI0031360156|nr:DUF559 domain-containing protein [Dehalococcoidia bacterium]